MEFYAAHAADGLGLDDLRILGPTVVLKEVLVPPEFGRRLVAVAPPGRIEDPRALDQVPAGEAFQAAVEARAYLDGLGLDLSPDPHTKTKTALEFFAAQLAENPSPPESSAQ
jgi:hypothetical protein